MSASLVYLLIRQILQMLTQLARDGGAKDVELLVLRHQIRGPAAAGAPPGAARGRPRGARRPVPGCSPVELGARDAVEAKWHVRVGLTTGISRC
jgi:hypothetical protein